MRPSLPPSLTVAFSTRGARALGLDAQGWPAAEGLDYLVLAQEAEADPRVGPHLEALASRPDVAVLRLASTGLSRSRNAALDAAKGEILLLADDDVTHPPGAFAGLRAFFAANPGIDLCAGQSLDAEGRPRKRPPARPRRAHAAQQRPDLEPRAGVPARAGAGEGPALRRGLRRRRRHRPTSSARSSSSSPTA